MIQPTWNDPSLEVSGDLPWQAQYRLLQSWYRETVLGVPPGKDKGGTTRGNMLPAQAVARNRGLNFLDEDITAYANERFPGDDRLWRNMLASTPLCFNLFGALRKYPTAAARGLTAALDLDINEILEMRVEWAPDPARHLCDKTSFDAFVRYRTSEGFLAFLGVETKYAETRKKERCCKKRYTDVTSYPSNGFKPGAEQRLAYSDANQLWRNALLVCSLRSTDDFDNGHLIVLSCSGNKSVPAVVIGLERELHRPRSLLRFATYEDLVSKLSAAPELSSWAREFRHRYLDLSPVRRGV